MDKLFRISKFQNFINSFKGFIFREGLLKFVFTRIFFCKIVPIATALTIFVPCLLEPIFVNAAEVIREHKNSLLVTTDSIQENITTPSGSVDAGPVNKKLFIKKLHFWPESVSKLFGSSIKDVTPFSTSTEIVPHDYTKECCEGAYKHDYNCVVHIVFLVLMGSLLTIVGVLLFYFIVLPYSKAPMRLIVN